MTTLRETSEPTSTRTVNGKLLRDLIRARVQLSKIEARVFRRDFLPVLRRMEAETVARLEQVKADKLSDVTRAQVEATLAEIRAIIQNAGEKLVDAGESAAKDVASREARMQHATYTRALPSAVELGTVGVEQLAAIVRSTTSDLFRPYARTWGAKALDKAKASIEDSVLIGEDMKQAARRLRDAIGASQHDAMMMARTGIQSAAAQVTRAYHDENQDVMKGVQWVATLDARTCVICGALDGKTWTYGEPGPDDEGPISELPTIPVHPGCRCTTAGAVKSWRELGLNIDDVDVPGGRASMNGEVPDSLSFEDWLKDQPEKVQRSVLGVARFDLFRRGELDLEDFTVDLRRRTLDELRR